MIYIVDTHAVVWFLEANKRLGRRAKKTLESADSQIVIPTIVLAEIKFLYAKRRIRTGVQQVSNRLLTARNCISYPLDEAIISKMPPTLEIHDAILVATALLLQETLQEDVTVITRDERIIESRLVNTI